MMFTDGSGLNIFNGFGSAVDLLVLLLPLTGQNQDGV